MCMIRRPPFHIDQVEALHRRVEESIAKTDAIAERPARRNSPPRALDIAQAYMLLKAEVRKLVADAREAL